MSLEELAPDIEAQLQELELNISMLRDRLEKLLHQVVEPAEDELEPSQSDELARLWLSIAVTRASQGDLMGASQARANAAAYSGRVSAHG